MQIDASAISLNVEDPAASAAFARRHFGFEEEMAADGFVSLTHPSAGFNLVFLRVGLETFKPAAIAGRRADGLLVVFVVGDVDAEYARLLAAPVFGELLYAFNREFGESTPSAGVIAERAAPLIVNGDLTVLLAADGRDGFAVLRFRPSVYTGALDAYLEELYVVPERRGQGLGRALLAAAMDRARERGAARIELNTSETDVAARALYESAGFTNREGGSDGQLMLYYEREL